MTLREMRKAKRLTQCELADRAGVTQSYLGALERGQRKNPSIGVVKGIADGLGVKVTKVLDALEEAV